LLSLNTYSLSTLTLSINTYSLYQHLLYQHLLSLSTLTLLSSTLTLNTYTKCCQLTILLNLSPIFILLFVGSLLVITRRANTESRYVPRVVTSQLNKSNTLRFSSDFYNNYTRLVSRISERSLRAQPSTTKLPTDMKETSNQIAYLITRKVVKLQNIITLSGNSQNHSLAGRQPPPLKVLSAKSALLKEARLTKGSRVSMSFILFPLRLRFVRLGHSLRAPSPVESLLSLNSNYNTVHSTTHVILHSTCYTTNTVHVILCHDMSFHNAHLS